MNSGAAFHGAAAGGRRDSVPGAAPADATSAVEDPTNQGYDMQALEATTAQTAPGYAAATARSDAAQGQQASLEGNMAELLEAAAKATTESQRHAAAQQQQLQQQQQQQQQQQHGGGLRKIARNTDLRGTAMHEEEVLAAGQKRKRTTSPDGGEAVLEDETGRAGSQSPRKRARQTPEVRSHTPMAHTPMSGADHHGHYHQSPGLQQQQQQQHQAGFGGMTPDARAVGVHSAAALFRTPSTGSGGAAKKHTRPPMSKLFASLQLTPENFLRLQAAAKQYMLDEAHPERQSCVGSRGKGDTDMVKLRLFNCCRDFLGDGIGERFFGPDVPAPTESEVLEGETTPGRKWVWPRDGNKIVSLVTPLLRRMVTNERQRQYAQETRKGGSKKNISSARETSQESSIQQTAATPAPTTPFNVEQHSPPNPAIDPALATPQPVPLHPQTHAQPQPSTQYGPPPTQYPRFLQAQPTSSIYSTAIPPNSHFQHHPPPDQNVIQVLITKNNTKLLPRIDMPSWPSTPHHTLPLSDLRKAVEEEVKGFLKRGLDLGIRRRSMSAADKTRQDQKPGQAKQKGDGGAEGLGDVEMEGADEAQQGTSEEPAQQQQEQPANDRVTTVSESGKEAAQLQPAVSADEPSLEGITLEIRALTGRGLVLITGEDEWRAVLAEVGRAVWMEGVLRVVVEVI